MIFQYKKESANMLVRLRLLVARNLESQKVCILARYAIMTKLIEMFLNVNNYAIQSTIRHIRREA